MSPEDALSQLSDMSYSFTEESFSLSQIFASVALAITLLFVIYEIARNKPRAKEYAIAWVIALIIYLIFLTNK